MVLDFLGPRHDRAIDANEQIQRMSEIYCQLSRKIEELVSRNITPLCVAGDCVSALGVLAGLQRAGREPSCIVWLDAHGDFHTWDTTRTGYLGGMPLAMMVGRGDQRIANGVGLRCYPEDRIVLAGSRAVDPGEREALERSDIVRCDISQVKNFICEKSNIYLHFDTDVVYDPERLPALKYHVGHGPSYSDISSFFLSLSDVDISAVSVSAWDSEADTHNKTTKGILLLLDKLVNRI